MTDPSDQDDPLRGHTREWPADVKARLGACCERIGAALGEKLVGLYVHGSLARRCFQRATSDIDLLAVTAGGCDDAKAAELLAICQNSGLPIDAAFVTVDQLAVDVHPAPVDFLIKQGTEQVVRLPEGSRDLLIIRQDAHEAGVALVGPPASELIPPTPWPVLGQALDVIFENVVERFKNPVLMLCRVVHAHANRRLASKVEAGQWASRELGEPWRAMIASALADYAQGRSSGAPKQELSDFQNHCAARIDRLRQIE